MGFKADTSFLRFLTMGAIGVRHTMDYLAARGARPIELERYGSSNKIWATKVKRLRLPDLLCLRTGIRIEVRAKSELQIRMSDAPANPERRWDVGLRDQDLVGLVVCAASPTVSFEAHDPVFIRVADLRAAASATRLGPPKSASEGAERDREWPCTVPKQDGTVTEVTDTHIRTLLDSGRRQTYRISDRTPYVTTGDRFTGGNSILSGVVSQLQDPAELLDRTWDPHADACSNSSLDRYAAAKAMGYHNSPENVATLVERLTDEEEIRVSLEVASALARLGQQLGFEFIEDSLWNPDAADLRMEAVLILTEIASPTAADHLLRVASDRQLDHAELRQAAVWGLGRAGAQRYDELISFLDDPDDDVALHAICAFGANTPGPVVRRMIENLIQGPERLKAASSEALALMGADGILRELVTAQADLGSGEQRWLLATIGRMPADQVRSELAGTELLAAVEPVLALSPHENWLATDDRISDLHFLTAQYL